MRSFLAHSPARSAPGFRCAPKTNRKLRKSKAFRVPRNVAVSPPTAPGMQSGVGLMESLWCGTNQSWVRMRAGPWTGDSFVVPKWFQTQVKRETCERPAVPNQSYFNRITVSASMNRDLVIPKPKQKHLKPASAERMVRDFAPSRSLKPKIRLKWTQEYSNWKCKIEWPGSLIYLVKFITPSHQEILLLLILWESKQCKRLVNYLG
jgi:hypothetical protein